MKKYIKTRTKLWVLKLLDSELFAPNFLPAKHITDEIRGCGGSISLILNEWFKCSYHFNIDRKIVTISDPDYIATYEIIESPWNI